MYSGKSTIPSAGPPSSGSRGWYVYVASWMNRSDFFDQLVADTKSANGSFQFTVDAKYHKVLSYVLGRRLLSVRSPVEGFRVTGSNATVATPSDRVLAYKPLIFTDASSLICHRNPRRALRCRSAFWSFRPVAVLSINP